MTAIFALTTRGLETLTGDELARIPGLTVTRTAYRRVLARIDVGAGRASERDVTRTLKALLTLKTADDLFLQLDEWREIEHTRAALDDLRARAADLNIKGLIPPLLTLRPVPKQPAFSVTASFVGARNYTMPEIKAAVAEGIQRRYPTWHYLDDDRDSDLNVRIFIERSGALVGLRLGRDPLHRRPYKTEHLPGSLKPTVAAAMLLLAAQKTTFTPNAVLLDPFCGGGTILAEAASMGYFTIGGDISAEAVSAARHNLTAAGMTVRLAQWDGRRLPLASGSVEVVLSNMPWGRQITVDDDLRALYDRAIDEMRRVLTPDGTLVILTGVPALLSLSPRESLEISLFGQNPVISIF